MQHWCDTEAVLLAEINDSAKMHIHTKWHCVHFFLIFDDILDKSYPECSDKYKDTDGTGAYV